MREPSPAEKLFGAAAGRRLPIGPKGMGRSGGREAHSIIMILQRTSA